MKKCNVFCVILKIAAILGAAAAVFVVVKKLLDKLTAKALTEDEETEMKPDDADASEEDETDGEEK